MATLDMDVSGLGEVKFGQDIRQKEFCLRPQSVFLNSGSFGTVPKRVLKMQKRYLDELESHPDHWFRETSSQRWDESRQVLADFVGADVEDIVFVVNVTEAVNAVLRSCKFKEGDIILASSLTYRTFRELWRDMKENICPGVDTSVLEIKLPIVSEDDLVHQYQHFLMQHPHVKLVLIDQISSPSSILMPVKRLVAMCRKHGAMVMVDGAHAPGQVPLNLRELEADFYTGNVHKWAYCPRGCGFLWVKRKHHSWVSPLCSTRYRGKSLSEQFFALGTRDHIPFICCTHALQFYQAVGGMDRVVGYTSELATRGRDFLALELGLERMDIPPSMEPPNIRMLKLPGLPAFCSKLKKGKIPRTLQKTLYELYNVQVIFDWVDGALYMRISVQIHNTMEDFSKLLPALRDLLSDRILTKIKEFARYVLADLAEARMDLSKRDESILNKFSVAHSMWNKPKGAMFNGDLDVVNMLAGCM